MEDRFMQRAIELAGKGVGKVNPNPLVGAVIVRDGRIIGEGYHREYGALHAERDAISHLVEEAAGAEMYVTLEPCCHHGKQPPCVDAIIEQGISRIYVGSDDPNELVAGKGIERLRNAGVEVVTHVQKEACDALNPVFFHYITKKTPYVVMKYAMTMDGKIATTSGDSRWITGECAREHTHRIRNWLSGIMVGIGTVLADNPLLNCRVPGGSSPVRIILDSHLRIPLDSQIVQTAGEYKTIVATVENAFDTTGVEQKRQEDDANVKQDVNIKQLKQQKLDRESKLQKAGIEVFHVPEKEGHVDLQTLMEMLGERQIDSILLEGGGTVNASALEAGIVNRVQVYVGSQIFGGVHAPSPVGGQGIAAVAQSYQFGMPKVTSLGGDVLLEYEWK